MIKKFIKLLFLTLLLTFNFHSIKADSKLSAEKTIIEYSNAVLTKNLNKESEYLHKNFLYKFKSKLKQIVLNTIKTGQEEVLLYISKVKSIKEFDELSAQQVYIQFFSRTNIQKQRNEFIDSTTKLFILNKKRLNDNKQQFIIEFFSEKTGKSSPKRIFTLINENELWKIIYIENIEGIGIDELPTQ